MLERIDDDSLLALESIADSLPHIKKSVFQFK